MAPADVRVLCTEGEGGDGDSAQTWAGQKSSGVGRDVERRIGHNEEAIGVEEVHEGGKETRIVWQVVWMDQVEHMRQRSA